MPEQAPRPEPPRSPERIAPHRAMVRLQTRLLMEQNAINPQAKIPEVTQEHLLPFEQRTSTYNLIKTASGGERKQYWEQKGEKEFDKQKQAWIESTTTTFQNAKDFFSSQSGTGTQWREVFSRMGIQADNFTSQQAEQLYNKYFLGDKTTSAINEFMQDVISAHTITKDGVDTLDEAGLQTNLPAVRWLANIFGGNSAEIVEQLLDAEAKLFTNPQALIQQANEKQPNPANPQEQILRINNLEPRETELLKFLWNAKDAVDTSTPMPTPRPTESTNTTTPPTKTPLISPTDETTPEATEPQNETLEAFRQKNLAERNAKFDQEEPTPLMQQYTGQEVSVITGRGTEQQKVYSCVLAAAVNALGRMGVIDPDPENLKRLETDIVHKMLNRHSYSTNGEFSTPFNKNTGFTGISASSELFQNFGLENYGHPRNTEEILAAIRAGGCAVILQGAHSRCITEISEDDNTVKWFDSLSTHSQYRDRNIIDNTIASGLTLNQGYDAGIVIVYPPGYQPDQAKGETFHKMRFRSNDLNTQSYINPQLPKE